MMESRTAWILVIVSLLWAGQASGDSEKSVPSRPEALRFPELRLVIPDAGGLRHELENGAVVYVAEDHAIPLVDVVLAIPAREGADPPGKAGLASLTASMIRQGGTRKRSAEELDQRIDDLGAEMAVFSGGGRYLAYLDCTQGVLEEALTLFFEMLREPGFQEDRVLLAKDRIESRLSERIDDPLEVLEREWRWLLGGQNDPRAQEIRPPDLEAIEPADLRSFHRQRWRPDSMVLAISGAVDTETVLALVGEGLSGWRSGRRDDAPGR